MFRVWISVVALASAMAQTGPVREPPRPISEQGLKNVVAFARLFGYVRHFHPSDEAQQIVWEDLAIQGIRNVEAAATPAELAGTLEALIRPIAPTVRVFPSGQPPELPEALRPTQRSGLSVVRWNYFGFPSSGSSPYHSERVREPLSNGAMPPGFPNPAEPFQAELGAGISCMVPLGLYVESGRTLPVASAAPVIPDASPYLTDDRATRLAGVVLAWNILQHFYPYFEVVDSNWQQALRAALTSAAADADEPAFFATLNRLAAALRDGHASVYRIPGIAVYRPPLAWDWIEGNLIVTRVADPQSQAVQRGDVILTIDGRPVYEALAEVESMISGATRQWIRYNGLRQLGAGAAGTSIQMEIESGGERRMIVMRRTSGSVAEVFPAPIQELEPGIMYVDVGRITDTEWDAALNDLARARGIVFEMRGYPTASPVFLQHLSQQPMTSAQWHFPVNTAPDQTGRYFERGGEWYLTPRAPYLSAKKVFLTDGRAISYAESCLGIIENYKLGEIAGGASAGTNGNVSSFRVLSRYGFGWTGMKVLKHDGSQHHGIGIQATVPVMRTRAGALAGRDEVLETGVELIRNSGGRPIGPGVVSGASYLPDTASPGAVMSVFGPAIGPPDGTGARLNGAGLIDTVLSDTRVLFDGIPAPLLYAGLVQVNAVVPYGAAAKANVRMVVEYKGQEKLALGVAIVAAAPAVFTRDGSGRGEGAIVNRDGTANSKANPAERGSVISVYASGEGLTDPPGVDGKLATGPTPRPTLPVSARIGGLPAEVEYAGAAPELVAGVLQVNVRVPQGLAPGDHSIFLIVGSAASQPGVTVSVR